MSTKDRNEIIIYPDMPKMLGALKKQGLESGVFRAAQQGVDDYGRSNISLARGVAGYVLHRESILLGRGSMKRSVFGADHNSPVSSVGLVIMTGAIAGKLGESGRHMPHGIPLSVVWSLMGGSKPGGAWKPGDVSMLSVFYKDSPLSKTIAVRAIDKNHFIDGSLARDARWRRDNNAPADPGFITGPVDLEDEYEAALARRKAQGRGSMGITL